ncbi:hypothetical protein B296_00047271 [Ensete ventricosum]|uniref:Uncharacterized protein n=1 Tax=Ensete ventricosum TaxID=4639 RepID=A0A426X5K2_ENSVE|nr:hypothetical protein B296_00047271 [Ensete ventricosum]
MSTRDYRLTAIRDRFKERTVVVADEGCGCDCNYWSRGVGSEQSTAKGEDEEAAVVKVCFPFFPDFRTTMHLMPFDSKKEFVMPSVQSTERRWAVALTSPAKMSSAEEGISTDRVEVAIDLRKQRPI